MGSVYDEPDFFQAYSKMTRSRMGLAGAGEWHQFKKLIPNLKGKSVLDLGCGYGWHCAYAAEQGAVHVVGIDSSSRMISEAIRRNPASGITYSVCDLNSYDYPAETYDCVISNLVLHYIDNLEEVYREVYRTFVPGGYFVLNIEHPVFTAGVRQEWIRDGEGRARYWPVDDYFLPGARETVFVDKPVVKQHHTLTQILMGLLHTGFCLEAVEEPIPPEEMMDLPGMEEELRRPMMLLIRARK